MLATVSAPRKARVLTRAVVRAAEHLGLSQAALSAVLGVSESSVSRLRRSRTIDPATKEGELAVLLVRLYRSLDSLVGGSEEQARLWMQADNRHLNGHPAELIRTVRGLMHVTEYLDAMRGKS